MRSIASTPARIFALGSGHDTAVRAVVLDADGLPKLADLPVPSGPGLRVRVRACGLCGSDVEELGRAPVGTVLGRG